MVKHVGFILIWLAGLKFYHDKSTLSSALKVAHKP
jgi:hypothetical protein